MDKKYLFFIVYLFFISFACYAQRNVNPNGFNKFYYPNGQLSSEGVLKDGKPNGYWVAFYPTGVKKSEGNRKNSALDSTWNFYNEAGDISQKINYRNGKKNGYSIIYSYDSVSNNLSKGVVISKELYLNGLKEGKSNYYYKNGNVKLVETYKEGNKHKVAYEYNNDSIIQKTYSYHKGYLIDIERINRVDKKGEKQGVWKSFYNNGRIKEEKSYYNDNLNGLYKQYEESGIVYNSILYKHGELKEIYNDSIFKQEVEIIERFYNDGTIKYSGAFIKGVPVGIHREFNEKGKIYNSFIYSDRGLLLSKGIVSLTGRKYGKWEYYFSDGKIKEKGSYTKNRQEGKWKYYYKSQQIKQEGKYKNGKYEGKWTWYYPQGQLLREEKYFKGKRDGEFIEYDKIGNIIAKGNYLDNEKEGPWLYMVGDLKEEGNYVLGLKNDTWIQMYQNEQICFIGDFIQGRPDGKHKLYYDTGIIKEERFYSMGLKVKNWKKYSESGRLILTITYKDDEEFRINGIKINFTEKKVEKK